MRVPIGLLVLATAPLLTACEEEATPPVAGAVDLRDYLLAPAAGPDAAIAFRVDSTLYDPAANGTDVRASSQTWTLTPTQEDDGDQLFLVEQTEGGRAAGSRFWGWRLGNEGRGIVNELDGVTYVSLVGPIVAGTTWDPLLLTDPDLVVPIEAEPIAIHKDWSARVDSVGVYEGVNDTPVPAVYVTHADSENRIELRRVTEVYGEGLGLLERRVDVLDSQNLEDLPWGEKAERGFRVRMQRIR